MGGRVRNPLPRPTIPQRRQAAHEAYEAVREARQNYLARHPGGEPSRRTQPTAQRQEG